MRRVILGDVYKPHTFEEIRELVTPEVAARLNPEKNNGVWWFNWRRVKVTYASEPSDTGSATVGVANSRRKVKANG